MLKTILAIFGITIGIMGLALSIMGFKTKAPAYITAFFLSQAMVDFAFAYFLLEIII